MKYSQSGPHLSSEIHNRPLNFRCDHCGQEFTSKEAKRRHEITVGDPPAKHRCWDCGGIFDESRKYAEHKIRCLEKNRELKTVPRATSGRPYNEGEYSKSNSIFTSTTKNPTAYIDRTNPTGLWIDDTPAMDSNSGAEDGSNESPTKNITSPRPTWDGGAHVDEYSTHMPERTADGHDRDYLELFGRSDTQRQSTLPTADQAPTNGRKPKDKACPLCPPGTKMFKTEKSLQLHMHSPVHVPRAHYGSEEGKGWKKMRDQLYRAPSTFESTNYVEAGAVGSVIDLVNKRLNGMSLASGALVDREAGVPAYRG